MRPGVVVTVRETPPPSGLDSDSGKAFFIGTSDRGPLVATALYSLDDFVRVFGDRQTYSYMYDAIDLAFREGAYKIYFSRVVGPGATSGTHNLVDGVAATSLVATAVGPGAWSSGYKVGVVAGGAGGTFQIQVSDASNVVLEQSGDLANQAAAVYWSQFSNYIRLTIGASALNPVVAALAALSAGTDDRTNITDTQRQAAIDLFTNDLGPGQVAAPGQTTDTVHQMLLTHATNRNRVALCDLTDSATVSQLTSAVAAARNGSQRYAASFAPWIVIPGLSAGLTRTAPPSALVAGLIARNEATRGTNAPSAGRWGISRYAIDLSQPNWTATDGGQIETLNKAGVNVIRRLFGGVRVYGWRTMVDAIADSGWINFGNSRLIMDVKAELMNVGETFLFDEIDSLHGETMQAFHGALAGVCLARWTNRELFGDTSDEAFLVDTDSVNTLATMQAQELHAVVSIKPSPMAEWVNIEIVRRALTEALT